MNVAVIGAGITGLGAAWLLSQKHYVTLFELETRLGGHSNTVVAEAPEGACPIDTGFIVYNTACYPNLMALFDHLGVPTAPTDMGFAVSLDAGRFEYCGSGLAGLVGNATNALSPAHWRMIGEIFRFFREASATETKQLSADVTLREWLASRGYSQRFIDAHIVPMGAAIWSTPPDEMLNFPFAAFARFFANHGLLQATDRPAWRTVRGGSVEYVSRIRKAMRATVSAGDPVASVQAGAGSVRVSTRDGRWQTFDGVLLACHADDARRVLAGRDTALDRALSAFRYTDNDAILHTDSRAMPSRRRLWSSWNFIGADQPSARATSPSVTYWMNRLQPLATATDHFVTLNPVREIDADKIVGRYAYRHPLFDSPALEAQAKFWPLQGRNSVWCAGSYLGYGFHEDGLQAGLAAAEDLSVRLAGEAGAVRRPWSWDAAAQSRITITHEGTHPVARAYA